MLIFQQFACSNKTVREVYYTKLFIESNLDFASFQSSKGTKIRILKVSKCINYIVINLV